MHLQSTDDVAL